jgi:ferritin-like metal-binding protein YciE
MRAKEKTLEDLFHDGLQEMFFAEKKIVATLPKMAKAADSGELRAAFDKHKAETEKQVERLRQIFELLDRLAKGKTCDAIMGIITEGQQVMIDYKDSEAIDAGLVAAAQSVEHYEIARYGTLKTWAEQLGMTKAAQLLNQTLQEEKKTDEALSKIAEARVNRKAA